MSRQRMRDWVWFALLILSGLAGCWLGTAPGSPGQVPVAAFALLAVWVLGLTWLVAGRDRPVR